MDSNSVPLTSIVVNVPCRTAGADDRIAGLKLTLARLQKCRDELAELRQTADRDTYIADVLTDCARVEARIDELQRSSDS
jgi:hypothetical protein